MKKTLLYAFAFAAISTFASCKCQTCVKDNAPDQHFCKDDFNTTNDYNDMVRFWENLNYKCHGTN